ncbi:hypothetical protein [Alteromonas gilva]|uniref:Uncharacterized protein n=1 Tax=Alteromonas gilva TaxID=2987522 RepID=A0ABT5L225_9ALTE|nr:hypothetical protein [Alteromonas gilva]MDC8831093.1 hypothetical protein [Alteromonas gilva]
MEKLEAVKQLVRANNYQNNDITFKQCQKLGFTVNRVGLEVFARKLRAIDKADTPANPGAFAQPQEHSHSGSTLSFEKSSIELAERRDSTPGNSSVSVASNITPINKAEIRRQPASVDPIERKREITFELGTIKVREYELLQELNSLAHTEQTAGAY